MEKPPALPNPGIAGGLNANAVASGTCAASARFRLRRIPRASNAAPLRSSHGLSETNRKALYVDETRVSRLKPTMVEKVFTPSVLARMPSIFLTTASVRSRDAAAGNCALRKRKP
jgi:hypothetical protein